MINSNCFSLNFLNHVRLCLANVQNIEVPEKEKMVDVPRFELGASSMPRKRASKLRHTPNNRRAEYADLRNVGAVSEHGRDTQGRPRASLVVDHRTSQCRYRAFPALLAGPS